MKNIIAEIITSKGKLKGRKNSAVKKAPEKQGEASESCTIPFVKGKPR